MNRRKITRFQFVYTLKSDSRSAQSSLRKVTLLLIAGVSRVPRSKSGGPEGPGVRGWGRAVTETASTATASHAHFHCETLVAEKPVATRHVQFVPVYKYRPGSARDHVPGEKSAVLGSRCQFIS